VSARAERSEPLVTRTYSADPNACSRALRLLLEGSVSKKAAGTSGGEDARKEDPNASGNVSISR